MYRTMSSGNAPVHHPGPPWSAALLALLLALLVLGVLAACGTGATSADGDGTPADGDGTPATAPITPTAPITSTAPITPTAPAPGQGAEVALDDVPATVRDAAQAALATHLGVVSTTLRLEQAEALEWPDSALGCPAPNSYYLQVITPGYRLVFRDQAGETYPVHTSETGRPLILCRAGMPVPLEA